MLVGGGGCFLAAKEALLIGHRGTEVALHDKREHWDGWGLERCSAEVTCTFIIDFYATRSFTCASKESE